MIADPDLAKLFKAESTEHLAKLDDGLLRLEKTPSDPELLEEIFRESHSLKGAARMLGLNCIEAAAHSLETVFNAARKGEAPLTPKIIDLMNAGLRDLRQCVQEVLTEDKAVADTPPVSKPEEPEIEKNATSLTLETQPMAVSKPPTSPPHTMIDNRFHIETVRVETIKLDDLLTQVSELSVIQSQAQHRARLLDELLEQWTMLERRKRYGDDHASESREEDSEFRLFGQSLKQTRDTLFEDATRLESVVHLMEDRVSDIRLLPLSALFALFPRMVHDLAREQDKPVEFTMEGGDITVDKRILEEMKDPLMHLLRNAIDHGIEPTTERAAQGKPAQANLTIRALRDESALLLEVSDDGRGLDLDAIGREACKRKLINDTGLSELTPLQIQQLIFTSGFSTSEFITELSGRGVGLDVVRSNVERLKGNIQMDSAPGQGLKVKLRLPFSIATTRVLLVAINGQSYGLPVDTIRTSRWVQPKDMFVLDGYNALLLNGDPVVVTRLSELLELTEEATKKTQTIATEQKLLACTILTVDRDHLGLLIDDLPGEEEVVLKPLAAPLKRVRNVSALAILANGDICPVLNPTDLLLSARKRLFTTINTARDYGETSPESSKPIILLAEDSALIRAMEKRILEDANYEVVTAVDGLDALNLLGSRSFAALVTDIVMPNMDGLTLTAKIRSNGHYQNLPVILVTSLASDEDKRRGLDAGANAYIPKPTFDQRVLLDTLNRLIAL